MVSPSRTKTPGPVKSNANRAEKEEMKMPTWIQRTSAVCV
jgi:hypothetical protein